MENQTTFDEIYDRMTASPFPVRFPIKTALASMMASANDDPACWNRELGGLNSAGFERLRAIADAYALDVYRTPMAEVIAYYAPEADRQ